MTEAVISAPPRASALAASRVEAVDLLRGLVIVFMVLDHTRDYFHVSGYGQAPLDPAQTHPLLYITRWITHLCAPTFVLLAGASAWLQGARGKSTGRLSLFLLTRGIWLVVLELTLIRLGWEFTFGLIFLQVIWAIGWSMIALAALVWLPRVAVLAIGAAIIAGHNLLDPITPAHLGAFGPLWNFLHDSTLLFTTEGQPLALVAYPVLPWAGVMAFGYGLGAVFADEPAKRDRALVLLGAGMLALFFVLRGFNLYGDPTPWAPHSDAVGTVMNFFNVQKYPPSLMYVCVTLGLVFVSFPLLARVRGRAATFLLAFGAVPLFAYVLHIYVLHALSMLGLALSGLDPTLSVDVIANIILTPDALAGSGYPLVVTYIVWALVLALLYPLCRWWAHVKRTRREWWLSYL